MNSFVVRRWLAGGLAAAAAFVSGSVTEPAPAGAHCGDHALSCGFTRELANGFCQDGQWIDEYDVYWNSCSGTCYNNGTQGCCESAEACKDAPCKPTGGCGGPCRYAFPDYENTGQTC